LYRRGGELVLSRRRLFLARAHNRFRNEDLALHGSCSAKSPNGSAVIWINNVSAVDSEGSELMLATLARIFLEAGN
jgi:hypothetical protein